MSMRAPLMRGGERRESLDDPMSAENNLSDDDNAQPEVDEPEIENEDPLLLAIDDLEGRVVAAIDEVKLHPGVRTDSAPGAPNIHEELAVLLRPVLEVAAHTGPSVARTYYRGTGSEGVEASVEDAYERTVSDLVLPVMLEMAQSDTSPAKRGASLEFFRTLYKECHKAGSWLDSTSTGPQAGPYGPGGSQHSAGGITPAIRVVLKRRQQKQLIREGEILRYWVEGAVACLVAGVFTAAEAEGAVASRGIIAASAALRPSLRHISQRIRDADDRGAARLYNPVIKMIQGVLKKLFLGNIESVRSACIKFLEILILCCSEKPLDESGRRKGPGMAEGFSLDDLPTGHPVITREALESIAEYAFTTLRGMTMMGGQVKIDVNMLSDMMLSVDGSPSEQVVSILKPAALAYLEVESSVPKTENDDATSLEFRLDRSSVELDFQLSQKSYALTINAMSALALNRPVFFKESAVCLARRLVDPPICTEGGDLTKAAILVISSQLRASCLTLLRHASSITSGASSVLYKALVGVDMELQADKALKMANQANQLKTMGRAARNQAKMFYEWDSSEIDRRSTKRQKETDDALAKMRAAKRQRGLGGGIQLPPSMTDAVELILLNLTHLPKKHPSVTLSSSKPSRAQVSLDFVIDAIMTNGASLLREEGSWYDRDGGASWNIVFATKDGYQYQLGSKLLETLEAINGVHETSELKDENANKRKGLFLDQCHAAASDAVGRILATASNSRSKSLTNLGNHLAARLAFTLKGAQPLGRYKEPYGLAKDSISFYSKHSTVDEAKSLEEFARAYPLVATSFALPATVKSELGDFVNAKCSLSETLLNEALLQGRCVDEADPSSDLVHYYDQSLHLFVAFAVHASQRANEKPNDNNRKRVAAEAASSLHKDIVSLPRLTPRSLTLLCAMCDIDEITKKANETSRKSSQETVATYAAAHAAKVAAEKRATAALLILRDVAFQRDSREVRKSAVDCAVGVASGRLPSSAIILDKALKLTMNVLFSKNESLADLVVGAALADLELAATAAINQFDDVQEANKETQKKDDGTNKNPLAPRSDTEKQALDQLRKLTVLIMALCVRRPEIIKTLFYLSCKEKADVLSKAVRANMSKLAKAAAAKHGAATIALQVAQMTGPAETPMLLSFLENLAPNSDKTLPSQEIIDACFQIQAQKLDQEGKKDPRYLIPIVSAMKRRVLVDLLPEFVAAVDNIFLAALVRMGDRVGRQALLFREEPDEENPSLHGMTLCEQLVYLHRLDFSAAGLPQKRYLAAIKLCLEDDEVYNDRVLMSALDEMSGQFLTGSEKLPLAFMRTNILVCTKHESLHSWICHVLLPRLVEGKIWSDPRQWEGWMRCAHMLEKSGDPNVNSVEAIEKLPPEQLMQYRTKWAK